MAVVISAGQLDRSKYLRDLEMCRARINRKKGYDHPRVLQCLNYFLLPKLTRLKRLTIQEDRRLPYELGMEHLRLRSIRACMRNEEVITLRHHFCLTES